MRLEYYKNALRHPKALATGTFVNCRTVPTAVKLGKEIYGFDSAVARNELPVSVCMRRDQVLYKDYFFIAKPSYLVLCRHIQ